MAGKKNKRELDLFLDTIVSKITSEFKVDEIILFGSYAKGTENEHSDIDIAVISPELKAKKPNFINVKEIKLRTNLREPGLQLFGFESKVFYDEDFVDPGFIKEIKNTGRKIYSATCIQN